MTKTPTASQAAGVCDVSCSNSLCQDGCDRCLWAVGSNCSCHKGTPGTAMFCPNTQTWTANVSMHTFRYSLKKFFADWRPSIHLTYISVFTVAKKRVAAHLSESSTAVQGSLIFKNFKTNSASKWHQNTSK